MTIVPMQPLVAVDWEKVTHVRVTLEEPWKGGGLRWRQGTTPAKKNMSFNAHDPESGPVYWPGAPIMYPEDAPAIAGDPDRDSFLMPLEAAMDAFGHFYAPLTEPRRGLPGFTQSQQRQNVAAFWHWYKMPPGDGTMNPPMSRIGPPDVPRVAIRPLTKAMHPMKDENGEEFVIRPFSFWKFDDPSMYDVVPGSIATKEEFPALEGLTREELLKLRELLNAKVAHGAKAS